MEVGSHYKLVYFVSLLHRLFKQQQAYPTLFVVSATHQCRQCLARGKRRRHPQFNLNLQHALAASFLPSHPLTARIRTSRSQRQASVARGGDRHNSLPILHQTFRCGHNRFHLRVQCLLLSPHQSKSILHIPCAHPAQPIHSIPCCPTAFLHLMQGICRSTCTNRWNPCPQALQHLQRSLHHPHPQVTHRTAIAHL